MQRWRLASSMEEILTPLTVKTYFRQQGLVVRYEHARLF
jgi:hypothetical protein